jgi:glycerophosphoryl diester phosphodiesterase
MLKIAHRGASGYELENSLTSLYKAIELKADVIEADVQLTKDKVPVIFHDRLLDRTSSGEGFLADYTVNELKENVLLNNGDRISSLEEFATIVAKHKVKLYLDLKVTSDLDIIVEVALKHLTQDQLIIGSFHYKAIKEIKQNFPAINTVMIIEGNPIDIERVMENSECDVVAFGFDSIEKEEIERVQKMGKKVFVWTVNHPLEIQMAKDFKVDGITTNYIDRL